LSTGSHTVDVRADVVKGAGYQVTVSVQQAADLVIYDGQLGVNIAAENNAGLAFTTNTAGTISINQGSASVVIDPTFQSQTNVTGGATNVVIAKYKIFGYGEDVKVSSLSVTPLVANGSDGTYQTNGSGTCTKISDSSAASTHCGLNNLTLYFNEACSVSVRPSGLRFRRAEA
jgi:hypothetical protein